MRGCFWRKLRPAVLAFFIRVVPLLFGSFPLLPLALAPLLATKTAEFVRPIHRLKRGAADFARPSSEFGRHFLLKFTFAATVAVSVMVQGVRSTLHSAYFTGVASLPTNGFAKRVRPFQWLKSSPATFANSSIELSLFGFVSKTSIVTKPVIRIYRVEILATPLALLF